MSEDSYLVEMDDDLDAPFMPEHDAGEENDSASVAVLSALSELFAIAGSLPPFHPTFQTHSQGVTNALRELGELAHRPTEIHIVRQGQQGSSRYVFVGPEEEPSPLAHGFNADCCPQDIDQLVNFLRNSDIALMSFEVTLSTRSLSRFVQLVHALKNGNEKTLRERIQFSGLHGIHILHLRDVQHSTNSDSPWLERIAATRVRSLLLRLPNPSQLDQWLHRGEGGELVRRALFSIGSQTSLPLTLEALATMPSPGQYSTLLELVLQTLSREDLLELAQIYMKGQSGGRHSSDVALSLGVQLYQVGEAKAAALLESLYRGGNVALENLPEEIRRSIRISSWTQAFDAKPFDYLRKLQDLPDPESLQKELNALGHVYTDLVAEKRYGNAELLVRYVAGLPERFDGDSARAAVVEDFLQRLDRVPLTDVADAFLDSMDTAFKGETLTFLTTSGPRGLPTLFTLLSECESGDDRSRVCNAIIRMGARAHSTLAEELQRPSSPWYVRRNILYILGKLGIPGHGEIYRSCLEDDDHRVQKEAAASFLATCGKEAWSPILNLARRNDAFRYHGCLMLARSGATFGPEFREVIWAGIHDLIDSGESQSVAVQWVGVLLRVREYHGPLHDDMPQIHNFADMFLKTQPASEERTGVLRALEGLLV